MMSVLSKYSKMLKAVSCAAVMIATVSAVQAQSLTGEITVLAGDQVYIQQKRLYLAGVKPIDSADPVLGLQARAFLDNFFRQGQVRCDVLGVIGGNEYGRCENSENKDAAQELIQRGLAVADRFTLAGNRLLTNYLQAEDLARRQGQGVWRNRDSASGGSGGGSSVNDLLSIMGMISLGFLFMGAVSFFGFRKLIETQDKYGEYEKKRDQILRAREKSVLAAALIGEIKDNKNKCEAFITIYSDMLRSLRDSAKKPNYQQGGDFIHKTPSLSREVYEGNIANMMILEPQLAGEITELYTHIIDEPDYISLEPTMPVDMAIRQVEMVVKNADSLIKRFDKLAPSLEVIVRSTPKVTL